MSDLTLTANGTFKAYDEDATISSDIDIACPVYTDGTNRYVLYNDKYYLIEPLKWRILNQEADGTTKILCDTIIEQVEFQKFYSGNYAVINGVVSDEFYLTNYNYSTLRNFMNNIFLNSAFSTSEQVIIKTTEVDNGVASMGGEDTYGYACFNTTDKVFALSYVEASALGSDENRLVLASNYAKNTGVETQSEGMGHWWLRSPSTINVNEADFICYLGFCDDFLVGDNNAGCLPAMNIEL